MKLKPNLKPVDYCGRRDKSDMKLLPGRHESGRLVCPHGGPMLAGFMWKYTHFQQGLNMTYAFQNGLIYTHQGFKGFVASAEIEVLTAALDSFSLILF